MFLPSCVPSTGIYQVGCTGTATLSSYRSARRSAEDSAHMQLRYLSEAPDFLGRTLQPTSCGQLEDNSWQCITPCQVVLRKQAHGSIM